MKASHAIVLLAVTAQVLIVAFFTTPRAALILVVLFVVFVPIFGWSRWR